MFRISTLLCIALFLGGAFGLYQVKYEVHDLRAEVKALEAELAGEREALHVARAEWAYLNHPERLQRLVEAHLNVTPLSGAQLAEVAVIPYTEDTTTYTASAEATASYLVPVNHSQ